MLGRVVPVPGAPGQGPGDAERSEDHEAGPPSPPLDEDDGEGRGERAAEAGAEEEHAVRPPPLAGREPSREGAEQVRERARLSGAEEEADDEQRAQAPGRPGQHREARPPEHDAGQYPARAHDVAAPARRHLEERVGEREGAEDGAHLQHGQPEVGHDGGRRGRDADPVQVRHDREGESEGEDPVADARRAGTRALQGRSTSKRFTQTLAVAPTCSTQATAALPSSSTATAGDWAQPVPAWSAWAGSHAPPAWRLAHRRYCRSPDRGSVSSCDQAATASP